MTTIFWLNDCSEPAAAGVGGKAGSLIHLHKGGFSVPLGFAIGAAGYRDWVRYNGLDSRIDALLDAPDLHLPRVAREATAELTPYVASAALPPELKDDIIEGVRELSRRRGGPVVVAVRSSALSEDGTVASSAGLYETFLNVRDESAVLECVSGCYRSLWAHRAVQYRAFKKLDSRLEAMGIVVMEMIPSDVSGVAFTVNPVTGDRGQIMINASWGLGEAIVSGRVTPDSFIVRKEDCQIISREVYEKELMIVADPGGGSGTVALDVPAGRSSSISLDDTSVVELAGVCMQIERYYGSPQDIEWAWHQSTLYILQARPVTGLA